MTAREIAHILTITPDPECAEDWDWEITCPYEESGMADRPGRTCGMSVHCRCVLTDDEKAALYAAGEGPCNQSKNGVHQVLPDGWGYDVDWCWARRCEDMADQVADVHQEFGCGTFLVAVDSSWETVEVAALACVEAVTSTEDLLPMLRTEGFQIGDIVCWRDVRWFEGRIVGRTAEEVRRQILRDHYEQRALLAKATTIEARNNRDSLTRRYESSPGAVRPHQIDDANRQLTAARTVEQDVCAMRAVYTGNRDFKGVAR